jgi:hypothetical protein
MHRTLDAFRCLQLRRSERAHGLGSRSGNSCHRREANGLESELAQVSALSREGLIAGHRATARSDDAQALYADDSELQRRLVNPQRVSCSLIIDGGANKTLSAHERPLLHSVRAPCLYETSNA